MSSKRPNNEPVFPPELHDEISRHLATDRKTLKTLCRVSRSFVPGCQRLIFAWQKLRLSRSRGNAVKMLQLYTESPHFARYTTHLTLLDDEDLGDFHDEILQAREELLGQLLPLFQNLTRLSLARGSSDKWRWSYDVTPKVFELYRQMLSQPSLVHVDLAEVPLALIYYLPSSVKYLTLQNPLIDLNPAPLSLPSAISEIKLTTLLIDGASYASCGQTGSIIEWILQSGLDLSSVLRLGLNLISSPKAAHEIVASLLQETPSLEDLSLTPAFAAYEDHTTVFADTIDLSALPSLRFLHISTEVGFVHNAMDIEPLLWLCLLLKKLPPTNRLASIVVSTEYHVQPTVHGRAFFGVRFESHHKLEKLLTQARFPRLRNVTFYTEGERELPSRDLINWAGMSILENVRGLWDRKILNFSSGVMFRRKLFASSYRWPEKKYKMPT